MKNEDAVKYWRDAKAEGEKYIKEGMIGENFKDQLVYYDTAIEALEKQIPKAPIDDPESWLCPNCKSGVWHEQQKMYCRQCGQLIAWNKI